MPKTTVHIAVIDLEHEYLPATLESILANSHGFLEGQVSTSIVPATPSDIGGAFLGMTRAWLQSGADFVGYLTTGSVMALGRLETQVDFMNAQDLVASYTDIDEVTSSGEVLSREVFRDFGPEMIGIECLNTESMLIDRKKFQEAGGFDYLMAGSYRPEVYLVTMAAIAGRISRFPAALHRRVFGRCHRGPGGSSAIEWVSHDAQAFWQRFQLERFVRQAREHYKSQGWNG